MDQSISESERLQIEQIRELDMEELQVEEVDGTRSSSSDASNGHGDGGEGSSGGFTYDTHLVSLHTYLGEVEDTHHRLAFLDGGAILNLPVFYLEGAVLLPEATLPLRLVQPSFIAAVDRALNQVDNPCTIGVVRVHRDPYDVRLRFSSIGTTAEIRKYLRLEDGSLNVVTRGQQRFRLRRPWIDVDGVPYAEIQIIQEDSPLRTPRDAFGQTASVSNLWSRCISCPVRPDVSQAKQQGCGYKGNDSESMSETSFENDLSPEEMRMHQSAIDSCRVHDRIDGMTSSEDDECESNPISWWWRSSADDSGRSTHSMIERGSENNSTGLVIGNQFIIGKGKKERGWLRGPPRSFWPQWVYQMSDSYFLARRAADMWRQIIGVPSMGDLVKKPDLLSFCIASKIPVSESTRQELLEIDGVSYRLRREIELLECFDRVRCKNCQTIIAKRSDMLVMSSDGPLGAYANPHGYVHEIMTVYKANGLALLGGAVKEHSWFPKYAWTIANCAACESSMGWLFTATEKNLKPKSFWGIRTSQVADDTRGSQGADDR
ncbi:protein cereblon [Macadamia integrifolia]|uniref:protein cereblon n=1 Tax=Macadamia integrifolia TaxID=60698 RepID=UPI001C4EB533|nr:protein cereblon [Macadamia integrifolia]